MFICDDVSMPCSVRTDWEPLVLDGDPQPVTDVVGDYVVGQQDPAVLDQSPALRCVVAMTACSLMPPPTVREEPWEEHHRVLEVVTYTCV